MMKKDFKNNTDHSTTWKFLHRNRDIRNLKNICMTYEKIEIANDDRGLY